MIDPNHLRTLLNTPARPLFRDSHRALPRRPVSLLERAERHFGPEKVFCALLLALWLLAVGLGAVIHCGI